VSLAAFSLGVHILIPEPGLIASWSRTSDYTDLDIIPFWGDIRTPPPPRMKGFFSSRPSLLLPRSVVKPRFEKSFSLPPSRRLSCHRQPPPNGGRYEAYCDARQTAPRVPPERYRSSARCPLGQYPSLCHAPHLALANGTL
jgi:hypothetical protein